MCDKSVPCKQFRREEDLMNLMLYEEDVTTSLSKLSMTEEESEELVHGPLNEVYYTVNCPFVWSEYISQQNMKEFIITHKSKRDGQPHDWEKNCFYLYFAFLSTHLGRITDAFQFLKTCEDFMTEKVSDEFYVDIIDGLNHAIQATKAHMCYLKGDAETADDIISSVIPLKDLSKPCRAALIALNAEILIGFGKNCKEMALKMAEKAIILDPDEKGMRRGSWYYLAGNIHGQLRRIQHRAGIPSPEELKLLERAAKINPLPVCLATLADSYREAASAATFSPSIKVSDTMIDKMNSEALRLYKQAYEMNDSLSITLRKCGNGLMKLPYQYRDINTAKKCLEQAVAVHPNSGSAHQSLGTMEERHFKNPAGALSHYQKAYECGNTISAVFIIQVRRTMDSNYNPLKDCDTYIVNVPTDRSQLKSEFYFIKGEYHFFVRNDLVRAAKEWMNAIKCGPESEEVKMHTCRVLSGRYPKRNYLQKVAGRMLLDVHQCLRCEVKDAAVSQQYTEEEKALLREALEMFEKKH